MVSPLSDGRLSRVLKVLHRGDMGFRFFCDERHDDSTCLEPCCDGCTCTSHVNVCDATVVDQQGQ
jgi:hypothetical protein